MSGCSCKCGNGCGGCKMYLDLCCSEAPATITEAVVLCVAPQKTHLEVCKSKLGAAATENGCANPCIELVKNLVLVMKCK